MNSSIFIMNYFFTLSVGQEFGHRTSAQGLTKLTSKCCLGHGIAWILIFSYKFTRCWQNLVHSGCRTEIFGFYAYPPFSALWLFPQHEIPVLQVWQERIFSGSYHFLLLSLTSQPYFNKLT